MMVNRLFLRSNNLHPFKNKEKFLHLRGQWEAFHIVFALFSPEFPKF